MKAKFKRKKSSLISDPKQHFKLVGVSKESIMYRRLRTKQFSYKPKGKHVKSRDIYAGRQQIRCSLLVREEVDKKAKDV